MAPHGSSVQFQLDFQAVPTFPGGNAALLVSTDAAILPFTYYGLPGVDYTVQSSSDLSTWTTEGTVTTTDEGLTHVGIVRTNLATVPINSLYIRLKGAGE